MSVVAALIAAVGNVIELGGIGDVYSRETAAFVSQGIAQDLVNLLVVFPATVVLALLARRGSTVAYPLLRHQTWGYAIGPGLLAFLALLLGRLATRNLNHLRDHRHPATTTSGSPA